MVKDIPKPPLRYLIREAAALLPLLVSPFQPAVHVASQGKGWPVLVLPGFTTGDRATSLLRRSLDRAGFHAHGWGMGTNLGYRQALMEKLEQQVSAIAQAEQRKVIVLGWSLGGLFARALAHRKPDVIAMVVTLGSPFSGDRRANRAWKLYNLINDHSVDTIPPGLEFTAKPPVPTIAVWSSRDGIVDVTSACGKPEESDLCIKLDLAHFGFGGTADGVRQVVGILATHLPD